MKKKIAYLKSGILLGRVDEGVDIKILVDKSMEKLRDRNSVWTLLGDLHDGGVSFSSSNETETRVLSEIGFRCVYEKVCNNGMTEEGLRSWARNSTWVIDEGRLYNQGDDESNKGGLIFVCHHQPKVLKPMRILRIESENGSVFVYIDDEGTPAYTFDHAEKDWRLKMSRTIKRLAKKRKKKQAPLIVIPSVNGRKTTIAKEALFYKSLIENRLCGYVSPDDSSSESVLRIILAHTEEQVKLTEDDRRELLEKVEFFMKQNSPIEITISLAIGCRIQNRLKYFDDSNLPTLGWMHLAWYFRFMNEKIKKIYRPGIKLVIFDEAVLFYEMMGITEQDVRVNLAATRAIIEKIGAPIQVYEMEKNLFPSDQVRFRPNSAKAPQVYAMVCSLQEMTDEKVMCFLYQNRDRDYEEIRQMVGDELWSKARNLSDTVVSYLSWRKEVRLFEKLGFRNAIDACITDKSGRIVFDITSGLLINHGMPVVKRGDRGFYKMFIVPEYRISDQFPEAVPIHINPKDNFGVEGEPYTFYYRC